MQNHTSAATSINKNKLPAVYNRVKIPESAVILDYGCGRYTNHIREAMRGRVYLPFDKYNQPDEVNAASMREVYDYIRRGKPVTVICSNVLNVIDDEETVKTIATELMNIAKQSHGRVYVTVYEGDRTGNGRETGPDQYQRNQRTAEYTKYFPGSRTSKSVIIIDYTANY